MRAQTCCFTGHRILPGDVVPRLSRELEQTVRKLIEEGYRYFGTGGALGFDTLAAETVLHLRCQYPQIRLILVLPCRNQTARWRQEDISRYEAIRTKADKVVYTAECFVPGCMLLRNRRLIDNSSVCVAYCTRETGGSAYTVAYARTQGLRVIFLR